MAGFVVICCDLLLSPASAVLNVPGKNINTNIRFFV